MAKEQEHPALAGVRAREETKNRQVEEYYAQDAQNRPTPTQAEVDAAKVGQPLDEKEADGSPPEHETLERVMSSRLPSNQPYDTRAIEGRPLPAEEAKRAPGRPPQAAPAPKAEEKK